MYHTSTTLASEFEATLEFAGYRGFTRELCLTNTIKFNNHKICPWTCNTSENVSKKLNVSCLSRSAKKTVIYITKSNKSFINTKYIQNKLFITCHYNVSYNQFIVYTFEFFDKTVNIYSYCENVDFKYVGVHLDMCVCIDR